MTLASEITAMLDAGAAHAYFGEPISLLEHGLQAAHFARAEGAHAALVIAALLHDVGYLLQKAPPDIADWHTDARHEEVGSAWLAPRFGAAVADPVRLHVAAKRFLCATAPRYTEKLSPASVLTLRLQGGPMANTEVAAFKREPYYRDAVRVRLWDDRAKVAGMVTAPLLVYSEVIDSLACPSQE